MAAIRIRSKYKIWDKGSLVPAYNRKINDKRLRPLGVTTAQERQYGLKYYIPADGLTTLSH